MNGCPRPKTPWVPIILCPMLGGVLAQSDDRPELPWPNAPELADFGGHAVGVRTPEVWYPASLPEGVSEGFSCGLIDVSRTGIIGYSMGGYGLVNVLGAGFTEASTRLGFAPRSA